jgi:hypothetical protein
MKLRDLLLIAGVAGLGYVIYRFIKKKYIPQKSEYCEEIIIFPSESSAGTYTKLCANTKEEFEAELADMLAKGTIVIRAEKL